MLLLSVRFSLSPLFCTVTQITKVMAGGLKQINLSKINMHRDCGEDPSNEIIPVCLNCANQNLAGTFILPFRPIQHLLEEESPHSHLPPRPWQYAVSVTIVD